MLQIRVPMKSGNQHANFEILKFSVKTFKFHVCTASNAILWTLLTGVGVGSYVLYFDLS